MLICEEIYPHLNKKSLACTVSFFGRYCDMWTSLNESTQQFISERSGNVPVGGVVAENWH